MSYELPHTIQRLHFYPSKIKQHNDDLELTIFSQKIFLSQERRSTKRKITIKELDVYIKIAAAYYFGFQFLNTKEFTKFNIFCVETLTFEPQKEIDNDFLMFYINENDEIYKLTKRQTIQPNFPEIKPISVPNYNDIQNKLNYTKYCNFFVKYLKTNNFGFLNSILLKHFNVYLNSYEMRCSNDIDMSLCPSAMDFSIATCLFNIIQLICQ
jgi:hypothetical protein